MNESALFQCSIVMLIFVYDISSCSTDVHRNCMQPCRQDYLQQLKRGFKFTEFLMQTNA